MHTARRKKRSFTGESQPETSNHFSVMFFRKTRLLSRRCIRIPQGARNVVLQETQPKTSAHFSVMFFRKTRKMSDGVQAYFKRNLTQYSGNSARTSNHFSAMFFRKTRKMSADVQAYFKRNLTQHSGNSARNLSTFFGDVFSQDKENKRRRTRVLQAKFDAVLRKNSPKNQISIMSASFFFAISSISLTYLSVIF